ncbi:MAG: pyruvate carboxylase [Acidobacteriia bacterium]|nr:pyruvate carboxylase [Terriglobia bacterium]MYG04652.1 pyruvate carboxylase [Terriglobia bacterium]MYK11797.1 pyruvate carboxylase [Terriglobia bacterium]
MQKLLAANRGEIATRIMRAATELGLRTATIYSNEDRLSLHRFKADEAYEVGGDKGPVAAYLDIEGIVALAKDRGIDAIHPGYGFLSENSKFARACAEAGITFVGPPPELLDRLGDKTEARKIADEAGVPIIPGTGLAPDDPQQARLAAEAIGYPLIVKASFGGGGRGMRVVHGPEELAERLEEARTEAQRTFGDGSVFLEKYISRARHIEVQILADSHGSVVHLWERDCSVQRRHQKVVELAPAANLPDRLRDEICAAAIRVAGAVKYRNAGTVEFLVDADSGDWYFIEVNPRVQVEHTVTETITGIDIVRSQILIAQGCRLHESPLNVPRQDEIQRRGFAIQCRITTEDPSDGFSPDYGRLQAYRTAAGLGIRLDGTAYPGAVLSPFYDSLLVKLTAWDSTLPGACARADRALREFRIRGVKTNIQFLQNVVNHASFQAGEVTTGFLEETPELFRFRPARDRANRLLSYIGDTIVNGNPTVAGKERPDRFEPPPEVPVDPGLEIEPGTRQRLLELGPEKFCEWVHAQERLLITDTTFRDAHQSLLATRVRTHDLMATAPAVAKRLPNLFSLEMWGGATFDSALRFLYEDPWERLRALRRAVPNICFQMLLRASNAVGYTSYPDNVVREFTIEAAREGIDVFRIFDSLNDVGNMRVAMDAVQGTAAICEPAICYTGDILDPQRPKYSLNYYLDLAEQLKDMGAHMLGIKDMAGLCRPYAAYELVKVLRGELGLPVHFHTHDSSGLNAATLLKASEAGVDVVDAAVAALSGSTSQPNLNTLVGTLKGTPRDTDLDMQALGDCSLYWETVRSYYLPFDNAPKSGSARLYTHEIPGGQFTNLQQQASAMGLAQRWRDVEQMYADVNQLLGDIVKVTPSSKVVGDLALFLLAKGMTCDEVRRLPRRHNVGFPDSVIDMMRGSLGEPPGGWPPEVREILLCRKQPIEGRAGEKLPAADIDAATAEAGKLLGRKARKTDALSFLLYPDVFAKFAETRRKFAEVGVLPTPVFFYGLDAGEECVFDIEPGKRLIVKFLTCGEPRPDGTRRVFFELNGQPREVRVRDHSLQADRPAARKAASGNSDHVGAPTPGLVTGLFVEVGDEVETNAKLLTLEAMKMQSTIYSPKAGTIREIAVTAGSQVQSKDLLLVLRS